MWKEIKKWGNSLVIRISPDEIRKFNFKKGDFVRLPDELEVINKKRGE